MVRAAPGQLVSRQTDENCEMRFGLLCPPHRPTDALSRSEVALSSVRRSHLAFLMKEISSFKGREGEGPIEDCSSHLPAMWMRFLTSLRPQAMISRARTTNIRTIWDTQDFSQVLC